MYGSTVRTAIAALAVGALGTLGLAVLAEVIARRREASPTAVADTATSDAASLGTDTDTSNGSRNTGRSGILPRLNLMRGAPSEQEPAQEEPSNQEPERQERSKQEPERHEPKPPTWSKLESTPRRAAQHERSEQESAPRKAAQHERSKQESAWQKAGRTFQQELSSESPADNGHRRPTTDRSP
jgi:hypothetical protein